MPTDLVPPGGAIGPQDNPLPVGKTLHHNLAPVRGMEGYGFSCSCGRAHHILDLIAREDWANYNLFQWETKVEAYQSLPFFGMCRVEMAHVLLLMSQAEKRRRETERENMSLSRVRSELLAVLRTLHAHKLHDDKELAEEGFLYRMASKLVAPAFNMMVETLAAALEATLDGGVSHPQSRRL